MNKYSWLILLALVVALGAFLRIYNIGNSYLFEGELGKELLYMRQFSLAHNLPLIGMPTSHEWLFYGPVYYWVMIPVFNLFNGNPFILFWAALAISLAGLILNYYIVFKLADRKVALYSTLIQAISPLLIWQTRNSKLHVFFFILSPLLMFGLWKTWNGNKKWVFWTGLIFGLMFSFHFSQIPLVGVFILLFWIKKNIYKWTDWGKFVLGALIPNISYVWQDWKIFAWLPYRTINIADKNLGGTIQAFIEYAGRNIFWDQKFWVVALIIFTLVFGHCVYTNLDKFKKEFLPFFLISSIGLVLLANIIHGDPPVHYFLPIFTIVPILYAIYLARFRWGIYILILIFAMNFNGYLKIGTPVGYIPYNKQVEISKFIVADSKDKPLAIRRVGPYDYFPEEYSQNYKYLILWQGGKLIENSGNIYTINENLNTVTK